MTALIPIISLPDATPSRSCSTRLHRCIPCQSVVDSHCCHDHSQHHSPPAHHLFALLVRFTHQNQARERVTEGDAGGGAHQTHQEPHTRDHSKGPIGSQHQGGCEQVVGVLRKISGGLADHQLAPCIAHRPHFEHEVDQKVAGVADDNEGDEGHGRAPAHKLRDERYCQVFEDVAVGFFAEQGVSGDGDGGVEQGGEADGVASHAQHGACAVVFQRIVLQEIETGMM